MAEGDKSKVGFFEESEGNKSATRLVFIIGSMWNIIQTAYLAVKGISPVKLLAYYSGIQAVLTGGKLLQKGQEKQ